MKLKTIFTNNLLLFLVLGFISTNIYGQDKKTFSSVGELLEFAKSSSYLFKNAELQNSLAQLTKKSAYGNVLNPKIPASFQSLNNIKQQISFLPGEAFGQAPGTFKEITLGQQFVSTLNMQPQFDIINLSNIAQVKTAQINLDLVENQNKINEQNLYEKINATYFNILSFQAQKLILEENIKTASQLKTIIEDKFKLGITRKQELNEAEVNLITFQDKLQQLELNLEIQYQVLNLFFENQYLTELVQSVSDFENSTTLNKPENSLIAENAFLQSKLASQEHKSMKYQNLPVLSFVSSLNWQNLSSDRFFDNNSNWINYNFIGLRLSYELPFSVGKFSSQKSKAIQVQVLKNNAEHALKENDTKNKQLVLEFDKSLIQSQNFKKIVALKNDTYLKNLNQFNEGILSLDKLLISQNDLFISQLNLISAVTNVGFNKTKIEINNRF